MWIHPGRFNEGWLTGPYISWAGTCTARRWVPRHHLNMVRRVQWSLWGAAGRIHTHGTWIPAAEMVLGIYLPRTPPLKLPLKSAHSCSLQGAQREVCIDDVRFTPRDQGALWKGEKNNQLNGDLDLEFIMVRVGGPEATTKRNLFHFERKGKGKDRPKQSRVMVWLGLRSGGSLLTNLVQ